MFIFINFQSNRNERNEGYSDDVMSTSPSPCAMELCQNEETKELEETIDCNVLQKNTACEGNTGSALPTNRPVVAKSTSDNIMITSVSAKNESTKKSSTLPMARSASVNIRQNTNNSKTETTSPSSSSHFMTFGSIRRKIRGLAEKQHRNDDDCWSTACSGTKARSKSKSPDSRASSTIHRDSVKLKHSAVTSDDGAQHSETSVSILSKSLPLDNKINWKTSRPPTPPLHRQPTWVIFLIFFL